MTVLWAFHIIKWDWIEFLNAWTIAPLESVWVNVLYVLCSRLRERTHSLWAYLMSEKQNYINPFYSPAYSEAHPVLEPSTLPYHFKSVQPSSLPCLETVLPLYIWIVSTTQWGVLFNSMLVCTCVPKVLEKYVPPVWPVHASTSVHSQNRFGPERE